MHYYDSQILLPRWVTSYCLAEWAQTFVQGAVLAMTRELAMIHAREGIRINTVSP